MTLKPTCISTGCNQGLYHSPSNLSMIPWQPWGISEVPNPDCTHPKILVVTLNSHPLTTPHYFRQCEQQHHKEIHPLLLGPTKKSCKLTSLFLSTVTSPHSSQGQVFKNKPNYIILCIKVSHLIQTKIQTLQSPTRPSMLWPVPNSQPNMTWSAQNMVHVYYLGGFNSMRSQPRD